MDAQPTKPWGPITLLCGSGRLRWALGILVTALVLVTATGVFRSHFRGLQARLSRVSVGMTRAQVENIFGPPDASLYRQPIGNGEVLYWVDQLWQVEVVLDGDGTVLKVGSTPSRSALRNTASQLNSLPN